MVLTFLRKKAEFQDIEMKMIKRIHLPAQLKLLNLDTSDFYRMVDMIPSTVFTDTTTEQPASALC